MNQDPRGYGPWNAGGYPHGAPHPYAQHPPYGQAQAYAQPPRLTRCQACGRTAPTKLVTLRQNIGCLILRFPKTLRGELCKRCIEKNFWSMTMTTLFLGWWGVISFFYSLYSIPANIGAYLDAQSLADEHPRVGR